MGRSWNFSLYKSEAQHFAYEQLLRNLSRAAIILPDGRPLHVLTTNPADWSTLPFAAAQCHQYLKLRDGDIAICNDPSAGGTRLSDFTLVMGVSLSQGSASSDLLIAHRFHHPPRLALTGKLSDEGLRIPPTPIAAAGTQNSEILTAISSHPFAPAKFTESIHAAVDRLKGLHGRLQRLAQHGVFDLGKPALKSYFEDCRTATQALLSQLPLGETITNIRLGEGELIKLRLEVTDEKLFFDFTGTEGSSRVQLTDLATHGACFTILSAILDQPIPANAGTFELIDVRTPNMSLINAASGAGTERGMTDGLTILCNLGMKAFAQIHARYQSGASALGINQYQINFADGKVFSDSVPGGIGAADDYTGADGYNPWLPNETRLISVEETETEYPLAVKSIVLPPNSAGKGKWNGGHAVMKQILLHADGVFRWAMEPVNTKPEGINSGKAGSPAEILFTPAEGEKEKLPPYGEKSVKKGDLILVISAGGGGFGEPQT